MKTKTKEQRALYNKYMREYHIKQYYRVRKEMVDSLGGKCAKCGCADGLELDHIDRSTKLLEISKIWAYSKEIRDAELVKCQPLCSDCHSLKSINERGHSPARGTHGSLSSYRYCHCDECKAAKREYNILQRHARGAKPRPAPLHGSRNMYVYHKCRCEPCTNANRVYCVKLKRSKRYKIVI